MTLLLRFSIALSLVVASGCISSYGPAAPVAPLLDEAGDVRVGASMRAVGPKTGASAFVAAAPSESTRVYVAGSFVHEHGDKYTDNLGRKLTERNDSKQVEAGAGYGFSMRHLQVEALTGAALGKTYSKQCDWPHPWFTEYPNECPLWVDARSWFVRPFLQGQAAASLGPWQGGGGVRVAVTRYQLSELFDAPSKRVVLLPVAEPFIVQRVGLDWVKFELTVHMPVFLHSTGMRDSTLVDGHPDPIRHTGRSKFALWPGPRVMLGVVFNLDEAWRRRSRDSASHR
jgi:hypothetical protein